FLAAMGGASARARNLAPVYFALIGIAIWVATALLVQSPGLLFTLLLTGLVVWALLNWIFPDVSRWRWLLLGLLLAISGFSWLGSLHGGSLARDFLAIIFAAGGVIIYSRSAAGKSWKRPQLVYFPLLM